MMAFTDGLYKLKWNKKKLEKYRKFLERLRDGNNNLDNDMQSTEYC